MALPIENFDSYTNGDDINGLNGGSGWSGAWSASNADGESDVSNAQSVSSPNSLQLYRLSTEPSATRSFSGETSGTIRYHVRRDLVTPDTFDFYVYGASTQAFGVELTPAGNIQARRSGGATILQSYSADTWYQIDIAFDCGTDTFTVAIDGGAPSSSLSFVNAQTSVVRYVVSSSANGVGTPAANWIDSIGTAAPSSNIKTIDGLAKASVKTVDGLAIASVKSWNGLE